jgi:hypothetical protein
MVSYFCDIVKDQKERTDIAANALFQGGDTAQVCGRNFVDFLYRIHDRLEWSP